MDASWLKTVCEPDNERYSGITKYPWSLEWNEERYTVATNGKLIVAVRGVLPDTPEPSEKQRNAMLGHLNRVGTLIGTSDIESLRAWVGPPQEVKEAACTRCNDGWVDCPCCGEADNLECEYCDAGKVLTHPDRTPGWVADLLIDRTLLAPILPHLSGPCEMLAVRWEDTQSFHKDQNALLLVGDGWRVLQMGMFLDVGDSTACPRFDLHAATTPTA